MSPGAPIAATWRCCGGRSPGPQASANVSDPSAGDATAVGPPLEHPAAAHPGFPGFPWPGGRLSMSVPEALAYPMESLLVVDDEPAVRQVIVKAFPELRVREASSGDQAIAAMREEIPDLVLLDHKLPDGEGLAIIQRLRAIDQRVPIVMLTGYGSTSLAVECFKRGAADYLEKPFKLDRLQFTVRNLLDRHQASRAGGRTRPALVARSHAMKELLAAIKRICSVPSNMPVLVHGEVGTGKELVARVVHERSHRSGRPFVA